LAEPVDKAAVEQGQGRSFALVVVGDLDYVKGRNARSSPPGKDRVRLDVDLPLVKPGSSRFRASYFYQFQPLSAS